MVVAEDVEFVGVVKDLEDAIVVEFVTVVADRVGVTVVVEVVADRVGVTVVEEVVADRVGVTVVVEVVADRVGITVVVEVVADLVGVTVVEVVEDETVVGYCVCAVLFEINFIKEYFNSILKS